MANCCITSVKKLYKFGAGQQYRDALEAAYPDLPFIWLEVSAGDQYVFLLSRERLL